MKRYLLTLLAALSLSAASAQTPKYIFYFIGDGMGLGPVMSAMNYKRMVHPEQPPMVMTGFPVVSFCQTYSASTPVTDSAAAGTALSTGHKTKNTMLGMDADTVSVTSVARVLKDDGWGVGVLTTVAPDDATPGAFYAHVPARSQYYDIDIQAANSGYDFLAGSSWRGAIDKEGNPTDVMDVFARNGYKVAYGSDGLKTIKGSEKVVLLGNPETNLNSNNIGYTIDSVPGTVTLPEMTRAALDHLVRVSPDRFFMMVEGGNIDHALHGNDGGAAVKEIINFNDALRVAYDFYLRHPDETLIVVTADHDTGGMTIINPRGAKGGLENIQWQRISKEEFSEFCKSLLRTRMVYRWEDMHDYLADKLGFFTHIKISEEQENRLKELFDKTFEMRNSADQKTLYASFNEFAVEVFGMFSEATGLGFTTTSHSGTPVPVFAVGVGAERFKSFNNNIEIPATILDLVNE